MNTSTEHPAASVLGDWLAERLSDDEAASVEGHLESCEECARALEGLADEGTDRLRAALTTKPRVDGLTATYVPGAAPDDPGLLFGVIALQAGFIDERRFVDACATWAARDHERLPDVLENLGWIDAGDRRRIEAILSNETPAPAPGPVLPAALVEQDPPPESRSTDRNLARTVQLAPARLDRLKLRELQSTGGIGRVWLAHDHVLGRDVALKELRPDRGNSHATRERFFREAQLTAQLSHPGTVPVYEYNEGDDEPFYTMKFVSGRTLAEVIEEYHDRRRRGETGLADLVPLLQKFTAVCQTIAYAHSQRIVHRDVKGENVVVGEFGEVIVLDWGLAKRIDPSRESTVTGLETDSTDSQVTMQGERLGTPVFMAPEQARGDIEAIDERTDVYQLAALLYEMLTGRPPFAGESVHQVLHAVEFQPPRSIVDENPDAPTELQSICLRGLSKKPADRQASAAEIGEGVERWIAHRAEQRRAEEGRERFFALGKDLLAVLDADLAIQQANPAWEDVLGWSNDELVGTTHLDLVHEEDHAEVSAILRRVQAGEPMADVEPRMRCRDGTFKRLSWTATPVPGESVVYVIGRDVTERRAAEQRTAGLLESAPDAIVVIDESGTIQLVNAQTEALFGWDRAELVGRPIETLVPEEFRDRHPEHVAGFVANPGTRPMGAGLQLVGRHRDGTSIPVDVSLGAFQTEEGLLVSAAVRQRLSDQ